MEDNPLLLPSTLSALEEPHIEPWRVCASRAASPWQWGAMSLAARLFATYQQTCAQYHQVVEFYQRQADGRLLCAELCQMLADLRTCRQLCRAIQQILQAHDTDPLFVQSRLLEAQEHVSQRLEAQCQRLQYDIGVIAAHYAIPLHMAVLARGE